MSTLVDSKKQLAKIIAHAWVDPTFKDQLVKSPEQVLRTEGIVLPENIKLSVVEDTPAKVNLVLSDRARLQANVAAKNDIYTVLALAYDKALADAAFKAELIADPTGTIRALGAELPAGLEIAVHSETDGDRFFALPLPPSARVRVELRSTATFGIDEPGAAPAAMLLKGHPDPTPTNVNVNVNANAQVNVTVNAAAVVNAAAAATVVTAAAATVAVVAAAIVLI